MAAKGSEVILPHLPDRSPTWQVSGADESQVVLSPREKGSRWPPVLVQLPSAGTGLSWMW